MVIVAEFYDCTRQSKEYERLPGYVLPRCTYTYTRILQAAHNDAKGKFVYPYAVREYTMECTALRTVAVLATRGNRHM